MECAISMMHEKCDPRELRFYNFGFASFNEINMLELYLNSKSRRGNSSSIEQTRVLNNSQRTTQTSQAAGQSKLDGNAGRQILEHEIINMKLYLSMTSTPYCYGESNLSNNEDNYYIDRVEVKEKDEDVELVEPINQYMTPPTFEFKVVSGDDQYRCNDQANNNMHSGLSDDELEVGKKFKDKFECINAVKQCNIKIHCSIRSIVQLKLMFNCNAFRN